MHFSSLGEATYIALSSTRPSARRRRREQRRHARAANGIATGVRDGECGACGGETAPGTR